MELPIANTLVSDHIIKALCNTLMHSLWQGVLLAVLSGLIIMFTKKSSAATRYNLLVAAMVLFVCGTVFTFWLQVQQLPGKGISKNVVQAANTVPGVTLLPVTGNPATGSFTAMVMGYFNAHANVIVLIWFLIICAKSVQMASGLHTIYHLKRSKVNAVDSHLENRIEQLAKQLGIQQTIKLLESGIAKVPMVIGHLKPVILIPIGLINSLSADEVEAILVHELAHIRRRDYLVNLLQSFMEIVFFFNPAVLWISKLIKAERENCCDDIAVTQTSSKVNYISALVSCQEYQLNVPAYSMALAGNKNSLVNRVKRIISNRNQSLNMVEKALLTICLVAVGLSMSAYAERENIKRSVHAVVSAIHHVEFNQVQQQKLVKQTQLLKAQGAAIRKNTALLNEEKPSIEAADTIKNIPPLNIKISPLNITPQVNVQLSPLNVQITPLNIQLAPLNIKLTTLTGLDTNYKSRWHGKGLNNIHAMAVELYRMHVITDTNSVSIDLSNKDLIVNGVKQPDDVYQAIYKKFGSKPGENSDTPAPKALARVQSRVANQQKVVIKNRVAYQGVKDSLPKSPKSPTMPKAPPVTYQTPPKPKPYVNAVPKLDVNVQPKVNVHVAPVPSYRPDPMGVEIADELLKENIITDKNDVTFKITNEELIVNGVKQPEALHKKILSKYVKKPGDNINYHYSNHIK
jgi:bla regulator protein BlaR1